MRFCRFLLIFELLLALWGCADSQEGRDALESDFAERYRLAHDSGEVGQMMDLFWWDGVDDVSRFFIQQALMQEIEYPILSIRFESLEPGDGFDYESEDTRFQPNLPPYARFVIEFDIEERLTSSFILGKHENRLYFVNAAPLEADLSDAK